MHAHDIIHLLLIPFEDGLLPCLPEEGKCQEGVSSGLDC